ncbi:MAG: TonB-dependent receptor plug domain-containing protein [Gemmatimonadetes bacterium]|nr:TonB-dependent receptor plug domain-containing protein [Gemmatimonadota bacterium]
MQFRLDPRRRRLCSWAATALLVGAPTALHAQVSGTLRGVVRSAATGEPVVGAMVQIVGTNVVAETDEAGRYGLQSVPLGITVIRITHSDHVFVTERLLFEHPRVLLRDFEMMAPQYILDEVVAKALQTVDVPDNTLDERELGGASSLREVIDQVGGVTLMRTGGQVGQGWYLRIRGAKSFLFNHPPVVFLDGVKLDLLGDYGGVGVLELLDPEQVARGEVLRGPAADARYGPDSANGVIVITTKRGPPGG